MPLRSVVFHSRQLAVPGGGGGDDRPVRRFVLYVLRLVSELLRQGRKAAEAAKSGGGASSERPANGDGSGIEVVVTCHREPCRYIFMSH